MPTRRNVSLLAAVFAAALWAACAPAGALRSPSATVTVLHFNDVHEIGPTQGGARGGLARVATAVDELRRAGGPLVVTLGGDFLSPSAIGTARIDGEPLAGRQAVASLNLLGVDWATLGNHEFDLPEASFRARIAEARFKIVSSNVTDASGKPFPGITTSAVQPVTAGGRTIRLGFIGLTIDFNRRTWVRYEPVIDAARRETAVLEGRVDAIIALTHQSLAADQTLAAEVPAIDLILGGHEHENWMLRRGAGSTPIVKADANGKSAAIVALTFGAAGTRPDVEPRLRILDANVAPDSRVQAEIARWMAIGFAAFRREGFDPEAVVATIDTPLDGLEGTVRNRAGDLTDLITAAMAREATTGIAVLNGGSVRVDDVLPPGPLTQYDVIRILPFGGKVLRATLAGELLEAVLDAGLQNQGGGGYLHTRGISRVDGAWLVQGRPLDRAAAYVVALPEFLLTGGEARMGFLTRANPQVRDVQEFRDIRQALITELKNYLHASSVIAFSGKPASRASPMTVSTLVSATSHG